MISAPCAARLSWGARRRETSGSGADELLERRFLAVRVEVGVALGVVAHAVHQLDRLAEMLERLVRPGEFSLRQGLYSGTGYRGTAPAISGARSATAA